MPTDPMTTPRADPVEDVTVTRLRNVALYIQNSPRHTLMPDRFFQTALDIHVVLDRLARAEADGPGSPKARLEFLQRFAVEQLGHDPLSARGFETTLIKAFDRQAKTIEGLLLVVPSLISFAIAPPTNDATRHARDGAVEQARRVLAEGEK